MAHSTTHQHNQKPCQAVVIKGRPSKKLNFSFEYAAPPLQKLILEHAKGIYHSFLSTFTVPRASPPSIRDYDHDHDHGHDHENADRVKKEMNPIYLFKRFQKPDSPGPEEKKPETVTIRLQETFYFEHLRDKADILLLYFSASGNPKKEFEEYVLYDWLPQIKHHFPYARIILVGWNDESKSLPMSLGDVLRKEDCIRLAKRIGAVAYLEVNTLTSGETTGVVEVVDVLTWIVHTTHRSDNH